MPMNENVQRFPLQWPDGWKRTPAAQRRRAVFGKKEPGQMKRALSIADALRRLEGELDRLGAGYQTLSSNVRLRLDGLPRSDQAEPADQGVAVYFRLASDQVLACDRWDRVADNIAAIAGHIEAMRAQERYGVGTIEQAFAGYAALPAQETNAWTVLGLTRDATREQVLAAHRDLARQHHPDVGGASDFMERLNRSRDEILKAMDAMAGASR